MLNDILHFLQQQGFVVEVNVDVASLLLTSGEPHIFHEIKAIFIQHLIHFPCSTLKKILAYRICKSLRSVFFYLQFTQSANFFFRIEVVHLKPAIIHFDD